MAMNAVRATVMFALTLPRARSLQAATAGPSRKPNFVVISVDDLGYGDLGFTGHPTVETPNIDRLAFEGKVLTTWYSGCPASSCSRAALLTGRQFPRTGVDASYGPTSRGGLPLSEVTLAEQLKKVGYATAAVGKWHLGQRVAYLPGNQGFDYYLGVPYSDDMGLAVQSPCGTTTAARTSLAAKSKAAEDEGAPVREMQEWYAKDIHDFAPLTARELQKNPGAVYLPLIHMEHGEVQVLEQPLDFMHLGEKYNAFAVDFIKHNKDKPFFLYVPFGQPHTTASKEFGKMHAGCHFRNKTRRGPFGDALAEVDWIVGNIHQALQEMGLEEDTLVLFSGSNGPWMAQGAAGGNTGLLRGQAAEYTNVGKGSTWEGGIREAAFAHWKGHIKPFSRSAEVVSSLDVFPTLSLLAGVQLPTDRVYDGRDMSDVLFVEDGRSRHDFLFFYGADGLPGPSAVRFGRYKAHFWTGPGLQGCEICKSKQHEEPLLFDVEKDPSESEPLDQKTSLEASWAIEHAKRAFTVEKSTLQYWKAPVEPDVATERDLGYAVCCSSRTTSCRCKINKPVPGLRTVRRA